MTGNSREYNRAYYAAHREEKREQNRKWREANPEKVKAFNDKWRAANPERVTEMNRANVAARKAARRAEEERRAAAAYQQLAAMADAMTATPQRCCICGDPHGPAICDPCRQERQHEAAEAGRAAEAAGKAVIFIHGRPYAAPDSADQTHDQAPESPWPWDQWDE